MVICFDGCDPAYIERGIADGILPTIASFRDDGFYGIADAVVPTFTNPNNASIVTGAPPAVHGISGNYYLDRATGEERMITDALADALRHHPRRHGGGRREDRRGHRQGQAAPDAGARARRHQLLLRACRPGDAWRRTASRDVEAMVGRRKPDQYSADLSLYVLDAGLRLLERKAATLLYLSLSDFVQHAHAPGTPEADAFNRAVDDAHRRAGGGGRRGRRGRRSRHERQVAPRRRSPTWCSCRRSSTAASATARCA